MTTWWKTNERHYCKYCDIWCGYTKQDIKHHESGNKHKFNVEKFLRDAAKRKEKQKRDKDRLEHDLGSIERAAHEQVKKDALLASRVPPAQQRRDWAARKRRRAGEDVEEESEEEEDDGPAFEGAPLPGEILGQYCMKNVLYLDGNWHEDLLMEGTECQSVWSEDDDWHSAKIERTYEQPLPGTHVVVRHYIVAFHDTDIKEEKFARDIRLLPPAAPAEGEGEEANDVAADVTATSDGVKVDGSECTEAALSEASETTAAPGGWTTVSVRLVPTDGAAVANCTDGISASASNSKASAAAMAAEAEATEGDAATAFNPFGGAYKGFRITSADEKRIGCAEDFVAPGATSAASAMQAGAVKFKRKKKGAGRKKFRRKGPMGL